MNIGFIALGKLGSACAVAAAQRNFTIFGYDPATLDSLRLGLPSTFSDEPDIDNAWAEHKDRLHLCDTLQEVVDNCDLLFLSPPTPARGPHLEGSLPWKHDYQDFDYTHLARCIGAVGRAIRKRDPASPIEVVIVSTVLPGTTRTALFPLFHEALAGSKATLIYSPSFIAQTTTIRDYHAPEFALLGTASGTLHDMTLYPYYLSKLHDAPRKVMTWENAELSKMLYNTYLGFKILWANAAMELSHRLNALWDTPRCDVDVISDVLKSATYRLISPTYLQGGMEDGGPCHGRDDLALATLAKRVGMSSNVWEFQADSREARLGWLAKLIQREAKALPIVLLGDEFKAGTAQTVGSPAVFLAHLLKDHKAGCHIRAHLNVPCCYVLTVNDPVYLDFPMTGGGVIVDPWGMLASREHRENKVIRIGRGTC